MYFLLFILVVFNFRPSWYRDPIEDFTHDPRLPKRNIQQPTLRALVFDIKESIFERDSVVTCIYILL